jgi:hypothetical protein
MHMSRRRAVLVLAVVATALPALPAYTAEATPPAAQPESASLQLHVPVAPVNAPVAPTPRAENRSSGLKAESEMSPYSSFSRHDNHSYGLASGAVPSSALNLSSSTSATRPGWQFSGRAGPVRWLAPLDGEGETKMRFGGRVPGQPRLPGMGLFNVSVHYAFE